MSRRRKPHRVPGTYGPWPRSSKPRRQAPPALTPTPIGSKIIRPQLGDLMRLLGPRRKTG